MKNINTTHEHGVALIFALGLLALMSVLGVAFVTNSLTAQKTAVNIGAKNQAQILMDSAVNRIMISLMGIMQQAPGGANDYSTIYSTAVAGSKGKGDTNTTWDQLDEYNGDSPKDELTTSKLSASSGAGLPEYDGSKSKANWVYIKDKDGYIIGRMAYQVLPVGRSSMSLDQVLLGIYNHDTGKPDSAKSPWALRLGKDIREFNIGKAFANGDAPFKLEWKHDKSGPYYDAQFPDDIYDVNSGFSKTAPFRVVESFEKFFAGLMFQNIIAQTDDAKRTQQINWFKHWFNESKNAYREVFLVARDNTTKLENAEPFFRFNLSDLSTASGKWYGRFKNSSDTNSDEVVKELLGAAEPWIEMKKSPKTGIPYLNRIANNSGGFDKMQDLRKQIAANLNDYCDSDDEPTSDKSAKTWDVTVDDRDKMPKYTGNEKTPYINEFALELDLNPTWTNTVDQTKLEFKPEAAFFTEIIDIYGGLQATAYKLKTRLKNLLYTIEATVEGEAALEGGPPQKFSVTKTINFNKPGEAAYDTTATFTDFPTTGARYAVAQGKLSPELGSLSIDFTDEIRNECSGKVIVQKNIDAIKITVKDVAFKLNAAALFNGSTGVDFVRGPEQEIKATTSVKLDLDGTFKPKDSTGTNDDWKKVYLSGMEVRDPRQNLNFTNANTTDTDYVTAKSDWKCVPILQNRLDTNSMTGNTVGSMEIQGSTFTGRVNSCSNPSSDDLYDTGTEGNAGVNYDKEKVIDPAWSSDDINGHLSTAFIRNAPMQSLWELGVIHRAAAWQTLNLKRAVFPTGTNDAVRRIELTDFSEKAEEVKTKEDSKGIAYTHGDAVILDQVKLTDDMKSSGKLDVNMLFEANTLPANWNKCIAKALFYNLAIGQQIGDLYDPDKIASTGTRIDNWNDDHLKNAADFLTSQDSKPKGRNDGPNKDKYISRADFIEGPYDPASDEGDFTSTLACGFGLIGYNDWTQKPDAQQEEIIGKTANLITAGSTPQTSINAVIVVQTIKPIKAASDTIVVKEVYKKNGKKVLRTDVETPSSGTWEPTISLPALKITSADKNFKVGRFKDSDGKSNFIYWDEITSELRALVTIKEHTDSDGSIRFQLSNIKYLGN